MPFNVLLLPLIGGYFFLTHWNRTRFEMKRHTGERLLMNAALAGLGFVVAAFWITHAITRGNPDLQERWAKFVPFPYAGTSILALVLALVSIPLANLFWDRDKEARRVIEEWGDHLEILLERALAENRQVSLTLKSGKVYIGYILRTFNPAYERKYIAILPVISGFREGEDQALRLTTSYGDIYPLLTGREDYTPEEVSHFQVIVPVGEIQSGNLFDPDAYLDFQELNRTSQPRAIRHRKRRNAVQQQDSESKSQPAPEAGE